MKSVIITVSLLVLSSCASQSATKLRLDEMIAREEIRSLQEITHHSQALLETHPELSPEAKSKIKSQIDLALAKHQELKNEEAKIVQLLVGRSFRGNSSMKKDILDDNELRKRLDQTYQSKAQNIFSLATFIVDMASQNKTSKAFHHDATWFLRDLR